MEIPLKQSLSRFETAPFTQGSRFFIPLLAPIALYESAFLRQLPQIAFGAVRVDGVVTVLFTNGDEISDVCVAKHAWRQMRDDIVKIPHDEKLLPALGDLPWQISVDDARTTESNADDMLPDVGTVVIDKFVAEYGDRGTVAVSDDGHTANGSV